MMKAYTATAHYIIDGKKNVLIEDIVSSSFFGAMRKLDKVLVNIDGCEEVRIVRADRTIPYMHQNTLDKIKLSGI